MALEIYGNVINSETRPNSKHSSPITISQGKTVRCLKKLQPMFEPGEHKSDVYFAGTVDLEIMSILTL